MDLPLEHFATMIRGITFAKSEGSSLPADGLLPVIRAGSIQRELLVDKDQIWVPREKIREDQLIQKDDIVMCTSSGSSDLVGKCAKAERDWNGSFGAFCAGIRPKKEICDPSFLYHFLSSPKFRGWSRGSSGANIKNIRSSELAKFPVPDVSLHEQKRIAAILDKADAIRGKRQQAIELAEQFLRFAFLEIFGDPIMNPHGWNVMPLRELAHIQIGPFGTQLHKEDYIEGGVPLVNPTHIVGGAIKPNKKLSVTEEKFSALKEYHLKDGDIVMGRRGEMGRCALVSNNEGGLLCGTGSLFIRPHSKKGHSIYLSRLLSGRPIKSHLEAESLGATMPNLNKTIVGEIPIPVPSKPALSTFEKILDKVIGFLENQKSAAREPLFESLSQRAFSGEL